ncbi:MAG: co-chaperone GroES [Phycisphaerales bacterium]
MNVKPLDDRIVVRPSAQETKTQSGIFLPETSKERPMTGKVIAVGPGRRLDNGERAKPTVKKGDTVVFGKYAGTEVEVKGDEHLILRESELLGILDG